MSSCLNASWYQSSNSKLPVVLHEICTDMASEALRVLQVWVSIGSPDLCWEVVPPFLQIIFNEAQICYLCVKEAWFSDTYLRSKVHHISPDSSKRENKMILETLNERCKSQKRKKDEVFYSMKCQSVSRLTSERL